MFPCQWNYRPDHCIYGSNCQQAEQEGVFILHGNRGVYHDDKQPAFRAVYEAIQKVSSSQKSTLPYKGNKYSSVLSSYGKLCSVKYMRHSMQESQPKTQIENPSCTLKWLRNVATKNSCTYCQCFSGSQFANIPQNYVKKCNLLNSFQINNKYFAPSLHQGNLSAVRVNPLLGTAAHAWGWDLAVSQWNLPVQ